MDSDCQTLEPISLIWLDRFTIASGRHQISPSPRSPSLDSVLEEIKIRCDFWTCHLKHHYFHYISPETAHQGPLSAREFRFQITAVHFQACPSRAILLRCDCGFRLDRCADCARHVGVQVFHLQLGGRLSFVQTFTIHHITTSFKPERLPPWHQTATLPHGSRESLTCET